MWLSNKSDNGTAADKEDQSAPAADWKKNHRIKKKQASHIQLFILQRLLSCVFQSSVVRVAAEKGGSRFLNTLPWKTGGQMKWRPVTRRYWSCTGTYKSAVAIDICDRNGSKVVAVVVVFPCRVFFCNGAGIVWEWIVFRPAGRAGSRKSRRFGSTEMSISTEDGSAGKLSSSIRKITIWTCPVRFDWWIRLSSVMVQCSNDFVFASQDFRATFSLLRVATGAEVANFLWQTSTELI